MVKTPQRTIRLELLSGPKPGFVPRKDPPPLMRSEGPIDYVCGKCSTVLLASVDIGQVQNFSLECPACGSGNGISRRGAN